MMINMLIIFSMLGLIMAFMNSNSLKKLFVMFFLTFYIISYSSMTVCFNLLNNQMSSCLSIMTLMILLMVMVLKSKYTNLFFCIGLLSLEMFSTFSLFYMYCLLDLISIFMFCIIMAYGYSMERYEASLFLMMYTLISSFFYLMLFNLMFSLNFYLDMSYFTLFMSGKTNYFMTFLILLPLMCKMPVWLFHYWLPKAHVEATMEASIVLAAIMLKLAIYVSYMINIVFTDNLYLLATYCLVLLSLVYLPMVMFTILDIKKLVAYSSIVHLSMIWVLLSMSKMMTLKIAMILGLVHSYSSGLMFFSVTEMYNSFSSRNWGLMNYFNKGMNMWVCWVIAILMAISIPPSSGYVAEFLLIYCYNSISYYSIIFTAFLLLLYPMILMLVVLKTVSPLKTFKLNAVLTLYPGKTFFYSVFMAWQFVYVILMCL